MTILNSLPHRIPWPFILYSHTGIVLYSNALFKNLFKQPQPCNQNILNIFQTGDEKIPSLFQAWAGRVQVDQSLLKEEHSHWNIIIIPDAEKENKFWLFIKESARNQAQVEVATALQQKTLFIANISHEIRNSLNVIAGLCETGLAEEENQKAPTFRKIQYCAQEVENLLQDVMDFSRDEMNGIFLEKISFDPVKVFEEVVRRFYPTTLRKNIELVALACPHSPRAVIGDPIKFSRLLTNLVSNAVKFTQKGFVHCYLDFTADNNKNYAQLTVHDSGIGIPADQLEKIFEPFIQGEPTISRKFGGYGLGLGIVRDLAHAMNGRVEVRSTFQTGSQFCVYLEFNIAPQIDFKIERDFSDKKILLLGFHHDIQCRVKKYFTDFQAIVATAADPIQAEQLWQESLAEDYPFSDVLIDLPLDTAPALPAIPKNKIILLTNENLFVREMKLLPKPLTLSALDHCVDTSTVQPPRPMPENKPLSPQPILQILITEDNEVNRELTMRRLKQTGHEVTATVDGLAALELWRGKEFDLVLVDIQMPTMDGLQFVKILRAEEKQLRRRPTKLVALTGQSHFDRTGFNATFSKPIRGADLINQINHLFKPIADEESLDEFHRAVQIADGDEAEDLKCAGRVFLRYSETIIQRFESAVQAGDPEVIRQESHGLKGMLALMNCDSLSQLAAQIESNPQGFQTKNNIKSLIVGLQNLQKSLRFSSVIELHGQDKNHPEN